MTIWVHLNELFYVLDFKVQKSSNKKLHLENTVLVQKWDRIWQIWFQLKNETAFAKSGFILIFFVKKKISSESMSKQGSL